MLPRLERWSSAPLWLPLGALLLSACATVGPEISSQEIETFERVLRARSALFLARQHLRIEVVGARLLRALPEEDWRQAAPYLGLIAGEANDTLADAFGVPQREGVLILGVAPDGPAVRAGLRPGDYLEAIGAKTIVTHEDLLDLGDAVVAGPVTVSVVRGETRLEVRVEVEPLPAKVRFAVEENDAVDAYATPGTITVTTGMLRFLHSDDELAIVLGHELAHITKRHALGRVALKVPPLLVGILAGIVAPGSQRLVSSFVERAVANMIRVAVTKVDRDIEREADIYGLVYAHRAGFDPRAGNAVWERFAVELPQTLTAALFALHPPSSERLLRIQKITAGLVDGIPLSAILEQTAVPKTALVEPETTRGALLSSP